MSRQRNGTATDPTDQLRRAARGFQEGKRRVQLRQTASQLLLMKHWHRAPFQESSDLILLDVCQDVHIVESLRSQLIEVAANAKFTEPLVDSFSLLFAGVDWIMLPKIEVLGCAAIGRTSGAAQHDRIRDAGSFQGGCRCTRGGDECQNRSVAQSG